MYHKKTINHGTYQIDLSNKKAAANILSQHITAIMTGDKKYKSPLKKEVQR